MTILEEMVPFPEAGAPMIKARKARVAADIFRTGFRLSGMIIKMMNEVLKIRRG